MKIKIKTFPHFEGLQHPFYATNHSAGLDLCAANIDNITIKTKEIVAIPFGFAIEIPDGYEAQIRSRSGLSLRHGVCILNSPGTIDSDYRGEIMGIMINHGKQPFIVERGMRIAQMVFVKVEKISWEPSEKLSITTRNENGLGSTGLSLEKNTSI